MIGRQSILILRLKCSCTAYAFIFCRDTVQSDEIPGDSVSSTSESISISGPLSYEPEESSTAVNDSKPEFVPGGFGLYQQNSDFAGTLDDIPVTLEVKLIARPLSKF